LLLTAHLKLYSRIYILTHTQKQKLYSRM
jgi:hypothetical protein